MPTRINLNDASSILIFIPARGGSKGILSKNLQKVGGVSLVEIAVRLAQEVSTLITNPVTVVVSSDDEKILKVAGNSGAIAFRRSKDLARDDSTTEDALLEYLNSISEPNSDLLIALLQCTSPFTRPLDVLRGLEFISSDRFDSVFLGTEGHYWLYRPEASGGTWVPDGHELGFRPSRQQVEPRVHETGAGYFFRGGHFMQSKFRLFGRIGAVVGDSFASVDIDEPADLEFARAIWPEFVKTKKSI
jgi:N-acylneuraminate cytidylyltransferase